MNAAVRIRNQTLSPISFAESTSTIAIDANIIGNLTATGRVANLNAGFLNSQSTMSVGSIGTATFTGINGRLKISGDLAANESITVANGVTNVRGDGEPGIWITGKAQGRIDIGLGAIGDAADLTSKLRIDGGLDVGGRIRIGGKLTTLDSTFNNQPVTRVGTIILPGFVPQSNLVGLSGQIILNANGGAASSTAYWTSNANVLVDGFTLGIGRPSPDTAPFYTRPSADLGGGAVGVAPFRFYPSDCVPAARPSPGMLVSSSAVKSGAQPIRVAHYGPVEQVPGTTSMLTIERFDGTAWVSANGMFTQSLSTNRRAVNLVGTPSMETGRFRVLPATNLRCADVTGTPPVAAYPDDYYFFLGCTVGGNPNPSDICGPGATYSNGTVDVGPDGILTIEDFLIFQSAFGDGTGCPSATLKPCNPADLVGPGATFPFVNGPNGLPKPEDQPDGVLSIEDFLIFLAAFGTDCE